MLDNRLHPYQKQVFQQHTGCACTAMQAAAAESNQQFASRRISFPTVCIRQFFGQGLRPTPQHICQQQHTTFMTASCWSLNQNSHLLIITSVLMSAFQVNVKKSLFSSTISS